MRTVRPSSALLVIAALAISGCGYSLRTSKMSSRLSKQGISRIYIHPVTNRTFRAGAENTVFNSLVRAMGGSTGIRPTSDIEAADAELSVSIVKVDRTVSGLTKASDLSPKNLGSSTILVASEYQAVMECSFSLMSRPRDGRPRTEVWKGTFSRSKPFPGNNQLWSLGSTSALINESELDRSLGDLAELMARDAVESMLEDF